MTILKQVFYSKHVTKNYGSQSCVFLPVCENSIIFRYVMAILKNTRVPHFRILAGTYNSTPKTRIDDIINFFSPLQL